MAKLKIFSVGPNQDALWLAREEGFEITNSFTDSDIVVFPGGGDWTPELYGEEKRQGTWNYEMTDKFQMTKALQCISDKKFILGICRGGQMLCILAGGKLIQHIDNHGGRMHDIVTIGGDKLLTNSIHHQMMDIFTLDNKDYDVLASTSALSDTYLRGDDSEAVFPGTEIKYKDSLDYEPEIVYFNKIGGFAIQGHPEMDSMPDETKDFIVDQIKYCYTIFQNDKLKALPKIVDDRIDHIKTVLKIGITANTNTNQTNINDVQFKPEKNWDNHLSKSGHWEY